MGFVMFLRFAVAKCVHFLAWPLFPLGYPLCASVRAIEFGLTSETEKLVTYWILLSLILLLEHAFAFLLQWLPGWLYVKLLAFLWLALPNFDRAFYTYNLLVRLCLSCDTQKISEHASNLMKSSTKSENFPDAAKRYLEENGPEALEKLVAQKVKHSELPADDQREIRGEATGGKDAASAESAKVETGSEVSNGEEVATPQQLKSCGQPHFAQKETRPEVIDTKEPVEFEWPEPDFAQMEIRREVKDGGNAATAERATVLEVERSETGSNTIAMDFTEQKGTSTESTADKDKIRKQWTCDLCQITVSGEKNLLSHVQGRRHQLLRKQFKQASSPNMGPWASTSEAPNHRRGDTKSNSSRHGSQQKRGMKQGAKVQNQGNNSKKEASKRQSAMWCDVCQIRMSGLTDLAFHLNGKRHLAEVQSQTASAPTGWEI